MEVRRWEAGRLTLLEVSVVGRPGPPVNGARSGPGQGRGSQAPRGSRETSPWTMGLGGLLPAGRAGEEGATPFRPFRSVTLPKPRLSTWPPWRVSDQGLQRSRAPC